MSKHLVVINKYVELWVEGESAEAVEKALRRPIDEGVVDGWSGRWDILEIGSAADVSNSATVECSLQVVGGVVV